MIIKRNSLILTGVFLYSIIMTAPVAASPRYLFFNRAPGMEWDQNRPEETITPASMKEVVRVIGATDTPALRIGVAFHISLLMSPTEKLIDCVNALLSSSEKSGVPVLIMLDGQNWWENRPDLWNWWDPAQPGYKPSNAHNVEWTDWDPSKAVKICWRNWGHQHPVAPCPNIASATFVQEHLDRYQLLVPLITRWWKKLPENRKHLFGGLKVGWEAGIGYNAYHYPDGNKYLGTDPATHPTSGVQPDKGLSAGLAQLGYAAVKTAGFKTSGEITRDDIGKAIQQYLATLSKTAHDLGIPREKLFTHQGGTYAPWDKSIPFWPAVNEWATPGWSFYWTDPNQAGGMAEVVDGVPGREWLAAEWWWGAEDEAGWEANIRKTLDYKNCRGIVVYNWNCGFKFVEDKAGQAAVRKIVAEEARISR